jgi:hypothetical protein
MGRIEKTVFLSYRRRTNALGARVIFQSLTQHGYDVFFDFNGIWEKRDNPAAAIADFQKFLNLGGGVTDGFKEKAEEKIRELWKKL